MPMSGKNPFHANKHGIALQPQSVTNTTANGETITEPWKFGRWITFLFLGGAWAATVDGALEVHGLARSDGTTWGPIVGADGTTTLAFLVTALDDGGLGEGGCLVGSLDLSAIDGVTYKAIRLEYAEGGNAAALVGAAYYISGLYTEPSGDVEYLYEQQRYE